LLSIRRDAASAPLPGTLEPVALVPNVVSPEVFWACTTCRACEEQCPVGVGYFDTIVGLRQNAVLMQGAAPPELHRVFEGLERQGNPWNFPRNERASWASELEVPRLKDTAAVEVLYWVGCAASYDARARAVARAFVRLMQRARIRFAILGVEEQCTGDSARRAGNELLFLQLAERNIERLNAYQAEGRFSTIVTTCPHCQSTLQHDYRDLGGSYEVLSHVEALDRWVREGRLPAMTKLKERVAYHDPCTLGRNLGVVDEPRHLLTHTLGCAGIEPVHHGKHTLCCGAGGAQMWLEEQNKERMNVARSRELLATGAERIVSACPFCLTMLTDGCGKDSALARSTSPRVLDIAELMELALSAPDVSGSDVKNPR
jgi:Fe-S oxidoreductase